jgi:hypothetical protein
VCVCVCVCVCVGENWIINLKIIIKFFVNYGYNQFVH